MIQLSSNKKSQSWKLDFCDELEKFQAQKKINHQILLSYHIPNNKEKNGIQNRMLKAFLMLMYNKNNQWHLNSKHCKENRKKCK